MEEITDRYTWKNTKESSDDCRNHFLLPKCIRGLLVGPSGCGKSTLMYTLLLKSGMLAYENLMVFGKALFQIEYRIIKAAFEKGLSKEQIDVIFENKAKVNKNGGPLETIGEYSGSCYGNITGNSTTRRTPSQIPPSWILLDPTSSSSTIVWKDLSRRLLLFTREDVTVRRKHFSYHNRTSRSLDNRFD